MKQAHSTAHFFGVGTCVVCGKEYKRFNANAKTCSKDCSKIRNRMKRDEWGLKNPTYQADIRNGIKKARKQIKGAKTYKSCINASVEECLNCPLAKCIFEEETE